MTPATASVMQPTPKIDLAALGIYDSATIAESAYARILLIGPAKVGKTTCIATTAPAPLVINCDGPNATKGAATHMPPGQPPFNAIDATTVKTWEKAIKVAEQAVAAGVVKTVIVDTLTLLYDNVLDQLKQTLDGFDLWNELDSVVRGGIKRLCKIDAHLFLIAHMAPEDADRAAGILPLISGQGKVKVPALIDDWVLLDCEAGRVPERQFLLGPQKAWNHSGRNIKRTCAVEATVPAMFAELGLPL